jgi:hypothetical protein
LFSDRNRTNFYKIYGRFEEIGVLLVGHDFHWLCKFGLDVLLGIDVKIIKTKLVYGSKLINNSTNIMEDLKRMF